MQNHWLKALKMILFGKTRILDEINRELNSEALGVLLMQRHKYEGKPNLLFFDINIAYLDGLNFVNFCN